MPNLELKLARIYINVFIYPCSDYSSLYNQQSWFHGKYFPTTTTLVTALVTYVCLYYTNNTALKNIKNNVSILHKQDGYNL